MKTKTFATSVACLLAFLVFDRAHDVRAQQPAMTVSMTLMQQVDIFQTVSQSYTLAYTPAPNTVPQVFVNGMLMCGVCGTDYTLNGTTLTFTGQNISGMSSVAVQVWYWYVKTGQ